MKKILITGTDGFVGSILKQGLQDRGCDVYGTVFFRAPQDEKEFTVDITQPDSFSALPEVEFDAVIHNAGIVDQNASKKLIYDVNLRGTKNLLAWCKKSVASSEANEKQRCKHFIQVSSSSYYGLRTMGQNRHEETRFRMITLGVPYQRSKAAAEKVVQRSSLPYTILRLPPVLGKNDTMMTNAICSYMQSDRFFHCGDKNNLLSLLVVDCAPALFYPVIEKGPTNTAYNCPSHHILWRDIVGVYADRLNLKVPDRQQPLAAILWNIADKNFAFICSNSRFGSHLPSDKYQQTFGSVEVSSWQDAVREAVKAYLVSRVPDF